MRTVALRSGLLAGGLIVAAAIWLIATPARLGAGP
jgi:hypothetical protein